EDGTEHRLLSFKTLWRKAVDHDPRDVLDGCGDCVSSPAHAAGTGLIPDPHPRFAPPRLAECGRPVDSSANRGSAVWAVAAKAAPEHMSERMQMLERVR